MGLQKRMESFARLGELLREGGISGVIDFSEKLDNLISTQQYHNGWFTPDNVREAILAIGESLTLDNIAGWLDKYPALEKPREPIKIAVIMAGNIPLVGFHDFLSVLVTGNRLIAKRSTKDTDLIGLIADMLMVIDNGFSDMITFTDSRLTDFDALIATGSDNSSRYFEYYFGKYPNIIRKNRNSIGIIDGTETSEELQALGKDIFTYFGLGCRNVSKIYIPEGYDIRIIIEEWKQYSELINHSKYANNYDYNKSIYLVNRIDFLDTGFLLIKKDSGLSSPVSVLFFEEYRSIDNLKDELEILNERLQCITGHGHIPFGNTQKPFLWEYADRIDTIEFILKINNPLV